LEYCASNPGYLGSSLGVVELTGTLHYVYDIPEEHIVCDIVIKYMPIRLSRAAIYIVDVCNVLFGRMSLAKTIPALH
jgi:hypothetical protein